MPFPRRVHDPDAVLDYPVDWSAWLAEGETITSTTVTAEDGITVAPDPDVIGGSVVVAWLSGGEVDGKYDVTYHIVTSEGREDDRSITLVVKER